MKNENKTDEMGKIMAEAHIYVPTLSVKQAAPLPDGSIIVRRCGRLCLVVINYL